MISTRPAFRHQSPAALRFALAGALTAACLIAATGGAADARPVDAQGQIQAELAKGNTDKAIALGEAEVTKAPQNGALRELLGRAYLRAGRFESAASALNDAVSLGGNSGRTVLSLALAQIACGQNRAALATLDRGQGTIGAADLGLALALAGDTEHGISVLTDSVRDGVASSKLRQNLAYAYALDGRWADAQLTAGFDLPPDQVQSRLQQWAQSMQTGGERTRIARLLDVPMTVDQGMPAALALNAASSAPAPELAEAKTDTNGELPAVAPGAATAAAPSATNVLAVQDQPAAAPAVVLPVSAVPVVALVAPAPAPAPVVAAEELPVVASPAVTSKPVALPRVAAARVAVKIHPVVPARQPSLALAAEPAFHRASYIRREPVNYGAAGGHVVQLGAFSSAEAAERAKLVLARRNPSLQGHSFLITQADVNGRNYWRVVTSGFNTASASTTCASLKRHGGTCFAYAANHAPQGYAPQGKALAVANTHNPLSAVDRRRHG